MSSDKFKRFLSNESRMSLREAKRICENAGYIISESEYTVQPKTKEELKEIIKETIKEQGPNCDLNFIDTSLIDDMSELFKSSRFNGDISKWNVSNVENMNSMFRNAKSFNQPIGDWDVSNVEDMISMFDGAKSFNQQIGGWNTSNVVDMSWMFCGAESFNQPIGKWNVSNVVNMSWMFFKAESFNQPIGDWDVSNVEDMIGMFDDTTSFNQPIGKWNTSNVTDMTAMFDGATSFNQSLDKWDVSKVKLTRMDRIFKDSPLEENPPKWYKGEYLNEARKAQKLSKGDYVGGCLESLYTVWRGIIVEDNVYYWYVWTGDEAEQGLQASVNAYKHNPKQAKRIEKYWLGKGPKFKIVCGGNDVYKFGSLEKANEWVDKIVERGYL